MSQYWIQCLSCVSECAIEERSPSGWTYHGSSRASFEGKNGKDHNELMTQLTQHMRLSFAKWIPCMLLKKSTCHIPLIVSLKASLLALTPCERCDGRDAKLWSRPPILQENEKERRLQSLGCILWDHTLGVCRLQRNLLHGIVGGTADVSWDYNQTGRL